MAQEDKRRYEFGPFVLDAGEKILVREGRVVPLTPRAYQVLLALVERSGRVVEKELFMREVWDGSLREESNLPQQVSVLRRTLGEANGEKYIQTVATRGYKFVATVRAMRAWEDETAVTPEVAATARVQGETPSGPPVALERDASIVLQQQTLIRVTEGVDAALPPRGGLTEVARVSAAEVEAAASRPRLPPPGLLPRGLLAVVTTLCVGLAAAALYFWLGSVRHEAAGGPANVPTPAEAKPAVKSIAVLPFQVRGKDAGNEYLEMGLAEAVALKLGGISSLVVRPLGAVEREYRAGTPADSLAVGRALNADAVLEASVQQAGDQVRVTARLLRVSDGAQLWSGKFDEEFTEIFRIQDSLSEQLSAGLSVELAGDERARLAKRHTQNPEAYRNYLMGRHFWRIDAAKSRRYFERSLAADPGYALAHAGLADTYVFGSAGWVKGEQHVREALRLDEGLAEPHATLGFIRLFHRWDWDGAGREFRRALELNPHYPTARQWFAIYLASQGHTAEAVAQMRQAVDLDPLSPALNADLGQMYFFAGDYERALEACRKAVELKPDDDFAHLYLFYIHAQNGRQAEAAESYLRFLELAELPPTQLEKRRATYREGGYPGLIKTDIDFLVNESKNPESYNRVAENYALLGDREQALHWLERAVETHNFFMVFTKVNPLFSGLRDDPRFQELIRRIGTGP